MQTPRTLQVNAHVLWHNCEPQRNRGAAGSQTQCSGFPGEACVCMFMQDCLNNKGLCACVQTSDAAAGIWDDSCYMCDL